MNLITTPPLLPGPEDASLKQGMPVPASPAAAPSAPQEAMDPKLERGYRRMAMGLGVGGVLVVASLVAWGGWSHAQQSASAAQALQQQHDALPQVRLAAVKVLDSPRIVELPGDMQPFDAATIFARSTGYIATRHVDIGSKIHKGDVLAVIASPDQDQQLAQAEATLTQTTASYVQAIANRKLAGQTEHRTADLVKLGWSSKQQGDTDYSSLASTNASVEVAKANIVAQAAGVQRLKELVGFEQVLAPFDGVVTARDVDVGSLVVANTASGTALFSIARSDVLRVQVYVPQEDYFSLKDGEDATVTVPELPGRAFHGKVSRNASALQAGTRTLLVEVDVDNHDGALTAGLYGIVRMAVPRLAPVSLVPSESVIFDKNGLSAAVFDHGTLRLHHLDVLADDGAQVEVRAGLKQGDQLILNPPQLVTDGMHVAAASDKATALQ